MSDLFPHEPRRITWPWGSCVRCGAMVPVFAQDRHERWHRGVDSGSTAVRR